MTGGFVWDYGTNQEHATDRRETAQILKEMQQEITKDNNRLVYSHKVMGLTSTLYLTKGIWWSAGSIVSVCLGHRRVEQILGILNESFCVQLSWKFIFVSKVMNKIKGASLQITSCKDGVLARVFLLWISWKGSFGHGLILIALDFGGLTKFWSIVKLWQT